MNGGRFFLALILLAAGFALGQVVSLGPEAPPARTATDAPVLQTTPVSTRVPAVSESDLTSGEQRDIEIFRRTSPSVVNITTKARVRDWRRMNVITVEQGSGSGFVWDRDGHVVTNHHVVREGSIFVVTLADHSEWEGKVVGVAPEKDLAVLRIDAPADRLFPLEVGTSRELLVGQRVLAVGNPFGLDHSLSTGVVSALGRELDAAGGRTIRGVIQTDAAINPGNSGGPLLDSLGRVIGVNTAIYSPSGASAGIGFAIPADTVRRLVPQLIEHGRPVQAGIRLSVIDDYRARLLGFEGVVVYQVEPGGPADRAGLLNLEERRRIFGRRPEIVADEITAVDGEPVTDLDEMLYHFEQAGVGGKVTLTVRRDGKVREVPVELARVR